MKTPGTDKTATNGNVENDENTPGPSNANRNGNNTPKKRPKCKYGKQCYRFVTFISGELDLLNKSERKRDI